MSQWKIRSGKIWETEPAPHQPGHECLIASCPDEELLLEAIKDAWKLYDELLQDWGAVMESKAHREIKRQPPYTLNLGRPADGDPYTLRPNKVFRVGIIE